MGDTPGPSSSLTLYPKSNLPMLYYGLVVVGTAAIVLALYNLFLVRWCTRRADESRRIPARLAEMTASQSFENQRSNLPSSFKFRKEKCNMDSQNPDGGHQCAVCLSVFEDGEEVRQLPRCKHSFHAPCIDRWLCSRCDCPLCRSPVDPTPVLSLTHGA